MLQSNISRLRKLLRPDADIVARPPGYVLQVADDTLDAGRFERLCSLAKPEPDPAAAIERLGAALSCWRGSAFEEFAELDWARPVAMRLDELRANAREDLLEARLALGEHAALVGELEALVAESPLRERLRHQLIVALYRSGRSAEALRQADAFRGLLRDELGLEPSLGLRELETRVLADDPTLLQTNALSRASKPRHLPAETTQLVGRAEELDQLIDRLHEDRLLTLTGPGGVGKTRLAMRLANDLWDDFGGEVFVAELAPVHDPASTVAAIATVVDVQQRQHLSVEETLDARAQRRRNHPPVGLPTKGLPRRGASPARAAPPPRRWSRARLGSPRPRRRGLIVTTTARRGAVAHPCSRPATSSRAPATRAATDGSRPVSRDARARR